MSRYRGPRVKIVYRLGALPGLTRKKPKSKSNLRNQSSGKKKKMSQYRIRLEEKQKLRFHYGLTERQLLRYVRIARRAKGSTGQVLLQLLEMRLDNIIFRLGMAPTIPSARQLVTHGHVIVNQTKVNIPSYRCQLKDKILIQNRIQSQALVDKNLNQFQQLKLPNHLTLNVQNRQAVVNQLVNRASIGITINELLIVEYYSRQA
uniref:Small ribosomal subunit protein uS4c n=1 Tax=Spirogyra maxima TaxID=3180 RepID=A0A191T4L2_SPIMX|nr:ribosomal protein S4 [Spirogyra maxima]ANI25329.1 ribosomal protein S4 [Spirogyra maxima]